MDDKWYSRDYLGKAFDKFLKSEMNLKDFSLLQVELQQVSGQLQELNNFIRSGSRNKTGKIHIKPNDSKGMCY